jgi:hypothetical protein
MASKPRAAPTSSEPRCVAPSLFWSPGPTHSTACGPCRCATSPTPCPMSTRAGTSCCGIGSWARSSPTRRTHASQRACQKARRGSRLQLKLLASERCENRNSAERLETTLPARLSVRAVSPIKIEQPRFPAVCEPNPLVASCHQPLFAISLLAVVTSLRSCVWWTFHLGARTVQYETFDVPPVAVISGRVQLQMQSVLNYCLMSGVAWGVSVPTETGALHGTHNSQ